MILKRQALGIMALALSSTIASAAPSFLVTHNRTNVESNAELAGTMSPYPTPANKDGRVLWGLVKMACSGHVVNNRCSAVIYMETNTNHAIKLGEVSMDIDSGDIMPKMIKANGYTLTVNAPGETTLTKD